MDHNNFVVNKYHKWYFNIISRAQIRNLPKSQGTERHHIIPKCLGGTNDKENLVQLAAYEHFICHQLLIKMTSGESQNKMRRAFGMFKMVNSRHGRKLTARQYQAIKKAMTFLPNPMSRPETKIKHLNSLARKIGYVDHNEYLNTVRMAFEKYKTIKMTAINTGHAQYTIRHLLLKNFGKLWLENIRRTGIIESKIRSAIISKTRIKRKSSGDQNYNAYVWEALSPAGEIIIVKGNRHQFCKEQGIGTSQNPKKPHLRGFWEFKRICKVKDYLA